MPLNMDATDQPQLSRKYTPKPAIKNATSQNLALSQDHHMSTPTTTEVCNIVEL